MNLYEKYREEFRQTIAKMNVAIDHHNRNVNLSECGRLEVLKSILEDMGHKVDGRIIADKETGMQRAIFITLDGESLGNFAGETKGLFEIFTPDEPNITDDPKEEGTDEIKD